MKTTRILSALLSATLALSSMPLAASNSVGNDTGAANQLSGIKPTVENGSVASKSDTGHTGDYYLSITNREDRNDDITYLIKSAPAAGTYYVSFDARAAIDTTCVGEYVAGNDKYECLKLRAGNIYYNSEEKR